MHCHIIMRPLGEPGPGMSVFDMWAQNIKPLVIVTVLLRYTATFVE
jgi:hypothetical protein